MAKPMATPTAAPTPIQAPCETDLGAKGAEVEANYLRVIQKLSTGSHDRILALV